MTLVSAPAGYGKSTLISSWLHDTGILSTCLLPDEKDDDPIRFMEYFVASLRKIIPSIQPDVLGAFQEKQASPFT